MTGVAKLLTELCRGFLTAAVRFSGRSMGFPQLLPAAGGFHRLSGRADRRSGRRPDESHSARRTCLSLLSKY